MSLLSEILHEIELNGEYNPVRTFKPIVTEFVSQERWVNYYRDVYMRDGEYVAYEYPVPVGDAEIDRYETTAYAVRPVEITVNRYVPV